MLPPDLADHRALFESMSEEEWNQWRHNPITRAYLRFIADQMENFRRQAAWMVENGVFDVTSSQQNRNPHVVRGMLLAMGQLQGLSVKDIQAFYRDEREAGQQEP